MEVLVISSLSVVGFCMALLLGKARPAPADRVLAIWLVLIAVNLSAVWVVERGLEARFTLLLSLSECTGLLHGPVLWHYTLALTRPGTRLKIPANGHLLPFAVAGLCLPPFAHRPEVHQVTAAAGILSVGGYALAVLKELNRHRRATEQVFSYVETVRLNWLRHTIFYLLIMLMIGLGSQLVFAFTPVRLAHYGNWYSDLFLITMVWLISFHGVRQHTIFSAALPVSEPAVPSEAEPGETRYQNSGLKEEEARRLIAEVRKIMTDRRPYLDPELTLFKLAELTGLPAHHLSQVINSQTGRNFFDFVNHYRVLALKEALARGAARQFTLTALAFDAGFNSKTSFNRAFKKFTGKTAREYLQELETPAPDAAETTVFEGSSDKAGRPERD
ncbi:helix-turn-helix domain-containing protein [Larkinella soli]|uniref:helix-turn-helix domain-containing protein n=1 Tax=Larkinella soli TaxID=1770527 RepID=UPI000FFB266D|nr:helix-turn-helix domain-containing protein [Larkinella soli]